MILEITVKMKDGKIFKYNSQAEAIKNARLQAGLSQEQAADLVGIKVQAWQKYEYGEREPKAEMLEKIAHALGVGIDKLCSIPLNS